MKKIISLILVIYFSFFAIFLCACQSDKDDTIRINETTHSVFYAPLYAAVHLGYFEKYGLSLSFTNGGGSDKSMTALMSGGCEIALLGPETAVYVKNQGSTNNAVIIGQLTQRDGSFLIGRTKETDFQWSDLADKEIIGGRQGGMPAMCLEYALQKNNLYDKQNVTVNYDVSFDLITSAFEGGLGDYCTMFEPTASQYEKSGKGYIVASVGKEAGDIAYTCFMVTKSYLSKNKETVRNFMAAVCEGINYCFTHTPVQIAEIIQPSFATTDRELLATAIENYLSIDAWKQVPTMTEASFNGLQDILLSAGTITSRIPYGNDIVDNSIVESIIAEQS